MPHFIRTSLLASLGLALLATSFAAPAAAQEAQPEDFPAADAAYVAQTNRLLDAVQTRLAEHGYELVSREVSAVDQYGNWDVPAYLDSETRYAVAAVCDTDCNDVDLLINDPEGIEAASDHGSSETAFARFLAHKPGSYVIQTRMYGCEAPACYAAMGLFKKTDPVE